MRFRTPGSRVPQDPGGGEGVAEEGRAAWALGRKVRVIGPTRGAGPCEGPRGGRPCREGRKVPRGATGHRLPPAEIRGGAGQGPVAVVPLGVHANGRQGPGSWQPSPCSLPIPSAEHRLFPGPFKIWVSTHIVLHTETPSRGSRRAVVQRACGFENRPLSCASSPFLGAPARDAPSCPLLSEAGRAVFTYRR